MAKEEWQDPDSGYLNCIGVGDTYVRKQMERIMSNNYMNCCAAFRGSVVAFGDNLKVNWK